MRNAIGLHRRIFYVKTLMKSKHAQVLDTKNNRRPRVRTGSLSAHKAIAFTRKKFEEPVHSNVQRLFIILAAFSTKLLSCKKTASRFVCPHLIKRVLW